MSRRKLQNPPPKAKASLPSAAPPQPWVVQNPHAAGIDVHSDNHVVCVGPGQVRTFPASTADLHALVEWLRQCQVTTVAMESTGVYWIPLFEWLEAQGFEVYLVEPGQLTRCGARPKTDVLDCQWIQRLHTFGLLKGSFRPPEAVLALRAYHRQRQTLIRYAAGHVQHVQKALEQMNLKLTEVLSDITGVTGMKILHAIVAGERDGRKLAALRHVPCAKDEAEIARALEGTWRPEHLFALKQSLELFEEYQAKAAECDEAIRVELAQQTSRAGDKPTPEAKRRRGLKHNDLRFEATGLLFQALGVNLTAIEGIDVGTALVILAEIGVDVSRFPSEKHFAAWLGLCPRTNRSNRTEKKRSPRKGKNRLAQALRMSAQSVGRTQTPLGLFYRRIKSRLGGRGACTATAHKLARLVYRMLRHGSEYVAKGMAEYEAKQREQQERALRRKAKALGYELVARPSVGEEPAVVSSPESVTAG